MSSWPGFAISRRLTTADERRIGVAALIRSLFWLLVKPSDWIAYTAVLGFVLWRLSVGRRLIVAAAILVVVLGVLPTAWLLTSPLEQRFPVPANLDRIDGIIVLAGAE